MAQYKFKRLLDPVLKRYAKFPVVALLGPRQSGKTTLAQLVFKKYTYLNLELPKFRSFAQTDPERFLREYENPYGLIIDEFQHAPELLSYIQVESDAKDRPGYFVLTGSQNFLMNEKISQSLAGRVGILTLLPFSLDELQKNKLLAKTSEEAIYKGFYPRLFSQNMKPDEFYPSYIHTYIERDVRQLVNIGNVNVFRTFMERCAGRIGSLVNIEELANSTGIDRKTVERWLSILEASYVIFFVRPFHKNFDKRLTKRHKLYFFDTGIACSLLGINSPKELSASVWRGPMFECLVMSDLYKQFTNLGRRPPLYFWRDQNGSIEIDSIVELGAKVFPLQIKASETIAPDHFFSSLKKWDELAGVAADHNIVIYGGKDIQSRSAGKVIGWQSCGSLIKKLAKE